MSENLSPVRSDSLQTLFIQVRGWRDMAQRNRKRWDLTSWEFEEEARRGQGSSAWGPFAHIQRTHPRRPQVQDLTGAKLELLC